MDGNNQEIMGAGCRKLYDDLPSGVFIYENRGEKKILYTNSRVWDIFGCPDEASFLALTGGIFPGMMGNRYPLVKRDIEEQKKVNERRYGISARIRRADGKWAAVNIFGCLSEEGGKDLVFCVLIDMDRKLPDYEMDSLTGYPGMHRFLASAEQFLQKSGHPEKYALLAFDIVHFKLLNLNYGIHEADRFLGRMGEIIGQIFEGAFISRFDVDHFMVLTGAENLEDRIRMAHDRILAIRPESRVHCTVGVYQLGRWGTDFNLACARVKAACDSIHDAGDRYFAYYTASMDKQITLKDYVTRNIDTAIEKGYIKAWYQPIVRTISGALCGMEALARWEDPVKGFLMPAEFIPALEESRQIHKLDLEIIRQVCENYSRSAREDRPAVAVSVNLSRLDFFACDIFQEVERRVRQYNVPRDMIHIEITERLITARDPRIQKALQEFREAGYELWMDDFGSDYSSLNLLKDYSFDVLKIDMAFLRSSSDKARSIISSVIAMDKKIGTRSLAEGVETKEQFEFLRSMGCEKAQGYYFGKPMPYEESLAHCMKEGLTIETRAWKKYYDDIGKIDFQTDETLAVFEYENHHLRYLFINRPYLKVLHTFNNSSLGHAEAFINDMSLEMARTMHKYVERCIREGKPQKLVYMVNDQFLEATAELVARCNGKACIRTTLSNITGSISHGDMDRLRRILHYVYNMYDSISLLDRKADTLEPLAISDGDWARHPSIPKGKEYIHQLALSRIWEEDYDRYMAFMDMDTLQQRLEERKQGFLTDVFRFRHDDGRYAWIAQALIPIPRTDYGKILCCRMIIPGDQVVATEVQEEKKEPLISDDLLWQSIRRDRKKGYFWLDREGRYWGASRTFLEIAELPSADALIGKTSRDMGWVYDEKKADAVTRSVLAGKTVENQFNDVLIHGHLKSVVFSEWPIYKEGKVIGILGDCRDAMQVEKEMGRHPAAMMDPISGAMNSRGIIESLIDYQEEFKSLAKDYAMLFLNIPQYRRILYTYGKETTGHLLQKVAGKIRDTLGVGGAIGRLERGGFIILFHYSDQGYVSTICRRLKEAVDGIHEVDGFSCTIGCEILVSYGSDGITTGTLIEKAVGMMHSREEGPADQWVDKRSLFDNLPLPYLLLDISMAEDGSVLEILCRFHNEEYTRLTGQKSDEDISRYLTKALDGEGHLLEEETYGAAYENHSSQGLMELPGQKGKTAYVLAPGPWQGSCVLLLTGRGGKISKPSGREDSMDHEILGMTRILMTGNDYSASMAAVLRRIGALASASRVYVMEEEKGFVVNSFRWDGFSSSRQPDIPDCEKEEADSLWGPYLQKSGTIFMKDTKNLAESDGQLWAFMKKQGIHSFLSVSLYSGHEKVGALCVDNFAADKGEALTYLVETLSVFISLRRDRHLLMKRLRYLSENDTLTGVHNRNAMNIRLAELETGNRPVGIIYADLNNLKETNDTLGHEQGDEQLMLLAAVMKSVCPEGTIYRLGGDEFIVLLDSMTEPELYSLARRLAEAFHKSSVDVALGSRWIGNPAGLMAGIKQAEYEMYNSKRRIHEEEK